MKPFYRAFLFLVILLFFDFSLRQGLIAHFLPFQLPQNYTMLFWYTLFAIFSWLITRWFCKRDQMTMNELGISLDRTNRFQFIYGFMIGFILWAIVSITQSYMAGFSWEFRSHISVFNILYGLVFIFVADLGTELFTRAYPLKKLEHGFGAHAAIFIMVLFVGLKTYLFNANGELLFYRILIPALHTIFFSIIYFKTRRLGAALGVHTGANFATISIFDLRVEQPMQAIPSGVFQSNIDLEMLSMNSLQLPYVIMAAAFCVVTYIWWHKY